MFQADLLKGKKVLVTGGGTGLGKSVANRASELGADVVICGRRLDVLQATAKEIGDASGNKVTAISCDIRNADAIEEMVSEIWTSGPLDILMNNAAGNFIAKTDSLSPRAIDAVLNTVLHGTFYMTVAVGRRWIEEKRSGSVLSVVSTPAFTGAAFTTPSAAAKAGVLAMTRSLAVEWGPKGIRLNAIAPGLFPTPGAWERLYPEGSQPEPQENSVPLRRLGEHKEFANMVAFLFSEGAAYMNGECVVFDGGRWMQGIGGSANRLLSEMSDAQWAQMRSGGK